MLRMDLVFHSRTGHADVERMARIARELGMHDHSEEDGLEKA